MSIFDPWLILSSQMVFDFVRFQKIEGARRSLFLIPDPRLDCRPMKRVDVAIAVIVRDGKVLICQRKKKDTFGGFWEFPGGKCEPGESLEDCLARELLEELDIVAKINARLSSIVHNYPHVHLTLHPFLCEHVAGEPKLIECQQVQWISSDELGNYRFPPANGSLLAEVVSRVTALGSTNSNQKNSIKPPSQDAKVGN
jgi:mutator protein MutT